MTFDPALTEQRFVLEHIAELGALGIDQDLVDAVLAGAGTFAAGE